jgi:hypothetical protein
MQCKLKRLQTPGKMETTTRKMVELEIQKESGLKGMAMCENIVARELHTIFLFTLSHTEFSL